METRWSCLLALALLTLARAEQAAQADDELAEETKRDYSNGFGSDIAWQKWPDALTASNAEDKPVFLLIHKSWCGACQRLKESFKTSKKRDEFVSLAEQFVMVNVEDDEEPEDEKYSPDGKYIPRLYFLDRNGDPLPIDNKKNYPRNAYYFPVVPDVLKAMKKALKLFHQDDENPIKKESDSHVEEEKPIEQKSDQKEKKKESEKESKSDPKADKKTEAKKEKSNETKKNAGDAKKGAKGPKKSPKDKAQKETKTPKTDVKKEKTEPKEECPHAAKARAQKEKAKQSKQTGKTEL